jgi:hypothetical protein
LHFICNWGPSPETKQHFIPFGPLLQTAVSIWISFLFEMKEVEVDWCEKQWWVAAEQWPVPGLM